MDSPDENQEPVVEVSDARVDKEEMVGYLSSTGKVRSALAGRLYDEGLDNWASLVKGDEEYFRQFKGVGIKTAEALIELAGKKMEDLRESMEIPSLREVLASIPRVTDKVIETLMENGYDTFESFKEATAESLQELKGIGPKLSETILARVNEVRERLPPSDEEIEEATGLPSDEDEQEKEEATSEEKGFFSKLIDGIKAIFVGKKEETPEEETTSGEKAEEEKKEEVSTTEEPEKNEDTETAEEDETSTEEPGKEQTDEASEEEPEAETPSEEEPSVEEESVEEEKKEEAPEEEKKGFLQSLKEMLFGKKKAEEEANEEGSGKEEEPSEEVESTEEDSGEEGSVEKEEVEKDKEPVEEEKAEGPFGLKGIPLEVQEKLRESGYLTIDELKEAVVEDLTMIDGIDKETAERICDAVKQ